MTDLNDKAALRRMEGQAVDLSDDARRREAVRAAEQEAAQAAAMEQVARWDRAMNRAFKGIVSRPQRHRMLMRASAPDA